MKKLSIGKIRGLQQITNTDGLLTICAMDHRESFQSMINQNDPASVNPEEIITRKLELCSILSRHASAVLLDPIYGAAQCIGHSALPRDTGLLVSVEASGYSGENERRLTSQLDGWSVEKIKRMGASAVKILVYYRPDLPELASQQLRTVSTVAEECIRHDVPFLVEPKSYPIGDERQNPEAFAAVKELIVIQTARDINTLSIDVLKAEFPSDLRYRTDREELLELCRHLDTASAVPWVILSGGVEFDVFCQQLEIASRAGASGFLCGRSIWQEAIPIDNAAERVHYLETVAADRLKRLNEIASRYAIPWYRKLGITAGELTQPPVEWYRKY